MCRFVVALIITLFLAGNVIAADWIKDGPPPGRWEIYPSKLISGQDTTLEIRYYNSDKEIEPNACFKFDMEPLSIKVLEHAPASRDMQIVPLDGPLPEIKIDMGPTHGVGFIPIKLTFPNGIKPGQSFALRYGNKKPNADVVAMINPIPVHGLSWNIEFDPNGGGKEISWVDMGWWKSLPKADIEGGPVSAMRIFAPSLVQTGKPFRVRIAVTDAYDADCYPVYTGSVSINCPKSLKGLPATISYSLKDRNSRVIDNVAISKPGVYRITASLGNGKTFESNPIVVRDKADIPIYWGLVHSHNYYSECWGDGPREHFRFGRDMAGLDYCALSDHMGGVPRKVGGVGRLYAARFGRYISPLDAFSDTIDSADEYTENGKYVAIPGYEGATQSAGHNNVYWADINKSNLEKMFTNGELSFPYQNQEFLGKTDLIMIHHLHSTYIPYNQMFVNSTISGYPLTPVLEANSDWGMAFHGAGVIDPLLGGVHEPRGKPLYQVIARGIEMGLIGDSDTHTGIPGRRGTASIAVGHCASPAGITATRADELSRHGIINAYRERNTYATSGERIFLDFSANGTPMGRWLRTDAPVEIRVEVAATAPITSVGIFNGDGLVSEQKPKDLRDGVFNFKLPAPTGNGMPYFVEVIQSDRHRAWSSPIWIAKASLPDLVWEKEKNGKLMLVNKGKAQAEDVQVAYSPVSSCFARPALSPQPEDVTMPCGQVWFRRWNDHRITAYICWKGSQMSGTAELTGYNSYYFEPNRGQWWHGINEDDGKGVIKFDNEHGRVPTTAQLTASEWRSIDLTVDPAPGRACMLKLKYDKDVTLHIGSETLKGRSFEVPLNGEMGEVISVGSLKPGQGWAAPSKTGFWSADPFDKMLEVKEDNNSINTIP